MSTWDSDRSLQAWNFASEAHRGQRVPGTEIPYINHVGLVAMEAMAAVACDGTIEQPDLLVLCALLHDVVEDTAWTRDEIAAQFGGEVADGVDALSKRKGLSSKAERMRDSLVRIRQQPREIWMVKLCDRITNLQPPPKHWSQEKIRNYREEARLILQELGEASSYLAGRLTKKIEGYGQDLS